MNISSLQLSHAALRRPLAWFLIVVFLLISGTVLAQEERGITLWTAPEQEGSLSPEELIKWEVDSAMPDPENLMHIRVTVINPENKEPHRVVLVYLIYDPNNLFLMRYEYMMNNVKYIYEVDSIYERTYKLISLNGEV